jgi:hypothetical protein
MRSPKGCEVPARGLELRFALARLARQHRVAFTPCILPLNDPAPGGMVLEGYASASDVDRERMQFRAYAFGYPLLFRRGLPPLYHRHDETRPVGHVDPLEYDDQGQLRVRATVTHELARRCGAFSIGAKILAYEIRDAARPSFHAVITSATVEEVSLTDRPANLNALVQRRYPVSAAAEIYGLLGARVQCLARLVEQMQEARP